MLTRVNAAYALPNDEVSRNALFSNATLDLTNAAPRRKREMNRLDLTHYMMVKGLSDKLYLAPIEGDKMQRILDIGTGTGICMFISLSAMNERSFVLTRRKGRSTWATSFLAPRYALTALVDIPVPELT